MNKKINIWLFLFLFLSYCLISLFLNIITSGGWSAIGELYNTIIYGALLFLALIITAIRTTSKKIIITPFYILIPIILFVQIMAILFNIGDCLDGSGSYNFIQTILNPYANCSTTSELAPILDSSTISFIDSAYWILLAIFLFFSFIYSPLQNSKLENNRIIKKIQTISIITMIILIVGIAISVLLRKSSITSSGDIIINTILILAALFCSGGIVVSIFALIKRSLK